jgi:hypothetical protein
MSMTEVEIAACGCDSDLPGIHGWMPPENRQELDRLIREHQIKTVIEIGSFFGLSAGWFARRVDHVTCVDTWYEAATAPSILNLWSALGLGGAAPHPRNFYSTFEWNLRRVGLWHKITPVRGDSREVHGLVGEADLVYIDGLHTYEGCASDIRLYAPKARKIVCGDDYGTQDNADPVEPFGVTRAVDEMLPQRQTRSPFWWAVKV